MKKTSLTWQQKSKNPHSTPNALQGPSKEKKDNAKNSGRTFQRYHECSQVNCRAYKSTSSDSDIEERIRTKATRFYKAYPKETVSRKPTASLGTSKSAGGTKPLTPQCSSEVTKVNSGPVGTCDEDMSINRKLNIVEEKLKQFRNLVEANFSGSDSGDPKTPEEEAHSMCKESTPGTRTEISEDLDDEASDDNDKSKRIRPFRSYPEDPLTVTIGFDTARMAVSGGRPEKYNEFRRRMLGDKYNCKSDISRNMRRSHVTHAKDDSYQEMRRKNNVASKKSRDARRAKEDELAVRCAYLEQENMFLKRKIVEMEEGIEEVKTP